MPGIRGQRRKPAPWPATPLGVDPEWAWAWRGLVFAAMPGQAWQWELTTRQLGQLVGTADWDAATEAGSALDRLQAGGADGGAYWPRPARLTGITNQCTMLFWVDMTVWGQVDAIVSIPYRDTGWTTPFVSLRLNGPRLGTQLDRLEFSYATDSTTLVRLDSNSSIGLQADAGDGRVHQYGVTRDGATVNFFRDGVDHGAQASGTPNATNVDWGTGSNVVLGTRSDASQGESMDGKVVLALIYDRPLSAAEIAQLVADPFGPFRPRRRAGGAAQTGAAALSGTATLAAAGTVTANHQAAAALSGVATITPAGALGASGAAALAATATLTAAGTVSTVHEGAAALAGSATLAAAGTLSIAGRATYDVSIDLNADGAFTGLGEDVSADVRAAPGMEITRGTDPRAALFRPIAGTGDLELDNRANAYGPASALDKGDELRIRATFNSITYPLFRGEIENIEQHPERTRRATTVLANGPFAQLVGRKVSTALSQNIAIGTAIGLLLDAAGFSATLRSIDAGKTTLTWWWLDEEDAFDALLALVNTEGPTAYVFEQGDGTISFRERYSLREDAASRTVQTTFRPSGTEPLHSEPFKYDDSSREVIDFARIAQRTRSAKASATVWSLQESVTLGPNETRTFVARESGGEPFTGATVAHTLSSGSLSAGPTLNRTSGANVKITLTAGASGAVLATLSVSAQAVTVDAESFAEAGTGSQSYRENTRAEISLASAQGLADLLVDWAASGRPITTITVWGNRHNDAMTAVLAREIGDRVRVIEDRLSYDAELWVRHVQHRVTEGPIHGTTFTLEDATGSPVYFLIGTSVIGGTDEIAPY